MSISLVGELALWVALLLAGWGMILSAVAGPLARADLARSGARAAHAATLFIAIALLALWSALVRTDLSLEYVAARGGLAATPVERVIALWSAPAGALLTIALATGVLTSVALASAGRAWGPASRTARWTMLAPGAATAQLVLVGILLTTMVAASPFARTAWALADGQGLPPAWRHVAMLVVWPVWSLVLGAAASAYALAIAAGPGASPRTLALWRAAADWVRTAWLLATAALLLALWWSYRTTPNLEGWMARATAPGALVGWGMLAAASSRTLTSRLRSSRAHLVALAAPLPVLMAASFGAAEAGWDPLHELAHEPGGAWWIMAIAALVLLTASAAVRVGTALAPESAIAAADDDPLSALGRRLAAVGAALAAAGLLAGVFRRDASLALAPGQPAAVTDVLGREWRVAYQGMSVRDSRTAFGAPRAREVLYPFVVDRGDDGAIIVIARVREVVDALGRPTAPPWPYPGIRHGALQDVVALPDSVGDADTVHVRIAFVPLPALIWLGGITLLVGGALVAQAQRGRRA